MPDEELDRQTTRPPSRGYPTLLDLAASYIEPDGSVEGLEARRRARATALLIVVLIPLGLLSLALTILFPSPGERRFGLALWISAATLIVLGFVYPWSRTRRHRIAALAALTTLLLSIWGPWWVSVDSNPADTTLFFLALPLLGAGLLIGAEAAGLFALVNLLGLVVLVPAYSPAVPENVSRGPTLPFFLVVIALLAIATARVRDRDVSELERLAEELEADKARLKELDAQRLQMVNNIVHDLRSPLTPMKIHLALIGGTRPPGDKALAMINRNLSQVERLINDLKDLSALESGRLRLDPKTVDLSPVFEAAVEAFRADAEANGISFETQIDAGLVASADSGRVTQVVYNFVTNALKFTHAGGRVVILARSRDAEVSLTVTDTGRGLTEEDMGKLFRPFSQVHDRSEVKERGTGLGLYICKGIVQGHGGRVWVASDGRGRGSTFGFSLPAIEPGPAAALADPGPRTPPASDSGPRAA